MRIFFTLTLGVISHASFAQQSSPYTKFGKISVDELQKKVYAIDSNANAVVLSDIGEAVVAGNTKGWFGLEITQHRVVHILNKNAYDLANVEIPLYKQGEDEQKLDEIKAVTYNLENGKIVESKLDRSSIFKEKKDKNWTVYKFTMPNVKEGCIIEFQYKYLSDYYNIIPAWKFQGSEPELWSEFNFSVPVFFSYGFISHGYQPLFISDRKERQGDFTVRETRGTGASESASFRESVTDYRWVMKDVPKLKEESFTSSINNHLSRIDFQLTSQNYPLTPHSYRSTWPDLTHNLLESEYFGKNLSTNNGWMSDDVKPLMTGAASEAEKARKIFTFIRDNFTCTNERGVWMDQSIKNVLKTRKGNVSEINLLLTAMLRYAGLNAAPVILSTTDHGYALDMYPMLNSFNYVVAKVTADGQNYYLDASHARLGFGKLLPSCFNGGARVVNETADYVNFSPDSLNERKVSALFITNDGKGNLVGNMTQTLGAYESYRTREKIKDKGKESFFKEVEKDFGSDVKISETFVDSMDRYEEPVALRYGVELHPEKEDVIYLNPLFGEAFKKNPFTSAERYYPVEMPYTMDETYLLTLDVPEGYVVDELPKQIVAKLDEEGKSFFEYRLSQSGNTISLRSRIKLAKTIYMPEEYDNLREFFNLVVSKQSQQIVFKKKK